MGKINVGLIVCLGLSTFYFIRESSNAKYTNTWLQSENRLLKDDNHALRDLVITKATAKTYEDGITDTLVRLNGPHGQEFAASYVAGYHAAMGDQKESQKILEKKEPPKVDDPKTPPAEKIGLNMRKEPLQ